MKKITLFLFFIICNSILLFAQKNDSSAVAQLYADFSIPDVSAFTLLGVNPDKVTRPTSPKDISTDVVNVAKSGNSIPAGLAIEWAPWMLFNSQKLNDSTTLYKDWKEFKKSRWKRELSCSIGTLQDSTGSKVAVGIAWCIYDKSDPSYDRNYVMNIASATKTKLTPLESMTNFRNEYLKKRDTILVRMLKLSITSKLMDGSKFRDTTVLPSKKILEDSIKSAIGTANNLYRKRLKQIDALIDLYLNAVSNYRKCELNDVKEYAEIITDARKQFKKNHWNAGILKFGIGQIWNSSNSTWQDIQSQKYSSYLAWGHKIGRWGQGILLGQYNHAYNDSSYKVNQIIIGYRLIAGSNNIHGSIEGVYQNNRYSQIGEMIPHKQNSDNLRSTVGIELRMNDGLWIELASGITGPSQDFWKKAGILGLGSIKYCFIKESRYNIQ